jgi:hypothetical protein
MPDMSTAAAIKARYDGHPIIRECGYRHFINYSLDENIFHIIIFIKLKLVLHNATLGTTACFANHPPNIFPS